MVQTVCVPPRSIYLVFLSLHVVPQENTPDASDSENTDPTLQIKVEDGTENQRTEPEAPISGDMSSGSLDQLHDPNLSTEVLDMLKSLLGSSKLVNLYIVAVKR